MMAVRAPRPFGYEYCCSPRWNWLQKAYIYVFGLVDLPTRIRFAVLRRVLDVSPCARIVDAGCAKGFYSFYLARAYPDAEIRAFDIDGDRVEEAEMVRRAMGYETLSFHQQDLSRFDEELDANVVLCFETLQYVPDDRLVLERFFAALAPGGALLLHVPAERVRFGGKVEDRVFTKQSLRQLLTQCGFRVERLDFTFGAYHSMLSEAFSFLVKHSPAGAVLLFPVLLALSWCGKLFHKRGRFLMAVARAVKQPEPSECASCT